jgi:hypothetical protein
METLCPSVQSSGEAARNELTLSGILRAFLPVLLHLLKLGAHKLRVLWQLSLQGIRPMIETVPLANAAEAYGRMMRNEARFRIVQVTGHS